MREIMKRILSLCLVISMVVGCYLPAKATENTDDSVTDITHHYLEPVFEWEEAYESCEAVFSCDSCEETHEEIMECEISVVTTEATCVEEGSITYTASCIFEEAEYTNEQVVTIEALGHNYVDGICENCQESEPEKPESIIEMPAERVVTYNGKGRTITVTNVEGSTGEITYKYYIDEACTTLVTKKNSNAVETGLYPRDPGIYYVVATVAEDENYKETSTEPSILVIKPKKVETLSATNTTTGVKLSWSKNTEADGYIIYRKTANGKYKEYDIIKKNSKLTYTDKYATAGTKYWYNIVAYSETADGEWIVLGDKRTNGKQVIWNELTITNYSSYVKLSWKKSTDTNVKGYYIYRKLSGESSYKKVKTITSRNTTSWKDYSSKTLVNGKKAQYYIKEYYGKSSSVTTKTASFTNYYLKRPSAYKSGCYLVWDRNSKADGYILWYDSLSVGTNDYTSNKDTKSRIFPTTMVKSKSKVRAYKIVNGVYYYSAWSKEYKNY